MVKESKLGSMVAHMKDNGLMVFKKEKVHKSGQMLTLSTLANGKEE